MSSGVEVAVFANGDPIVRVRPTQKDKDASTMGMMVIVSTRPGSATLSRDALRLLIAQLGALLDCIDTERPS